MPACGNGMGLAKQDGPIGPALASTSREASLTEQDGRNDMLCDAVTDIAAALFSVPASELRRDGRTTRRISRVRQIAMYCAHTILGLSQKEVGRAFRRDRTTVLHACHTVEDLRDGEEFDRSVLLFEAVVAAAFRPKRENPLR